MLKKILIILLVALGCASCEKSNLEDYELYGETLYDDPNSKLWRHRVNEIDGANKYLESFTGLEIDVFYNIYKNRFYVSHDDDYNFTTTTTLDEYWSNIDNVSDYYYWIDLKNLNLVNHKISLIRMLELMDTFEIKNNTIVESSSPRLLKNYNGENIYTSYWVPAHSYDGVLSEENIKDIEEIQENLSECEHNALSSHSENLLFLTDHFHDYNLHLWTNGLIGEEDKELINNLKTYSNVKVILIDYEEPF